MAANGISTLATKQARQLAKLRLAAQDRAAASNARSEYDITQLPTQYSGNDLVDNPNTGGLVVGRPWIETPVVSYAVVPRQLAVDEGLGNGTVFDIYTTGVADGTSVYFTVTGTVEGADFTGGTAPSGSTVVTDGASAVSFGLIEDSLTEGLENYALEIRTGSTSGPVVATSALVTVNDTSTGSGASPVLTDDLVVHLDAGDTDSYPGSGTTWTNLVDDTEYTIANGSFDSDDGGSIVFNGTSTIVPIGTPLSNNSNLTKEAWVWDDGAGNSNRNILSSEDNVLFLFSSTLSAGVGGGFTLVGESSFSKGAWRHVAQTFDDSTNTMRLYINGVEVDENTSVSQSYTSQTERIGAHVSGGNPVSFWNGKIAQVRVYSEALTESQVVANYDATKATYGL